MAATYTQLPISVRDVFSAIVGEVSDNLSTESTLDIDSVSFYCETWLELIQRLEKEGRADMTRYPFIALIRNFDLTYDGNKRYPSTSLTFVIVTPSTKDKYSEDRESENYVPILRPIYAEFMAVLKDSGYLLGYSNDYLKHTYTESLHLGTESEQGNNKYMLPEVVDGIIITDMDVTLIPETCLAVTAYPSTTLRYLNNVSELNITADMDSFTITFTSAQYTDTLNVGYGATPLYEIYTSHDDATHGISVSDSVEFGSFAGDLSGMYYGYIQCDDGVTVSKLYFSYLILSTNVRGYTQKSKFVLDNFNTIGDQYTNYPFDVTVRQTAFSNWISYLNISIDGGNEMWNKYYSPVVANMTEETVTITQALAAGYRDVTNTIRANNDSHENISYYKQN
jgi:hypothetical protein